MGEAWLLLPPPSWGPSGSHTSSAHSVPHLGNEKPSLLPHRATKAQRELTVPEAEAQKGPLRTWLVAKGGKQRLLIPSWGILIQATPAPPGTPKSRPLGESQAHA